MKNFFIWDYVSSLIVPFQFVLFFKFIVLFVYNLDSLDSFYSFTSFLTMVLFSSPISLIALILLLNWFAHFIYLFFIVLLLCPCISFEAWRLFYLGFISQIPLSLDFIELFMYIYIGIVYILGLLVTNEAVFELKACLLIFVAFRLNHLIRCWQFSVCKPKYDVFTMIFCLNYGLFGHLQELMFYFFVFILSSFCLIWPVTISIILGMKLYFEFDLLAFNTIGSVTILLFLIHIHLSLFTIRIFIVNKFIKSSSPICFNNKDHCMRKLIFLFVILIESLLFMSVFVYASTKFYLSELFLTSTGYAKISSHVIFSTIFFCLIYLYQELWPELVCLWKLVVMMNHWNYHFNRYHRLVDWSIFDSTSVHNRCGLCLLPVFRAYFDSVFITHSPLLNCLHFFHQSCANVCGLLSLPCLQCEQDNFYNTQGIFNYIYV